MFKFLSLILWDSGLVVTYKILTNVKVIVFSVSNTVTQLFPLVDENKIFYTNSKKLISFGLTLIFVF